MLERWRPAALLLHEGGLWDGQAAHAGFDAWCEAHAGRRCTLWLSSALLFELVCEPGLPLADDAAALHWARGVLLHYHGEAAAAWPLAAWQHGRVRGVSALHGAPLEPLQAAAARSRVRLVGVRPWWSGVLRLALQRHAALRGESARLVVAEGALLTVLDLARGQVQAITQQRLDAADPALLEAWAGGSHPAVVGYALAPGLARGVEPLDALDRPGPGAAWLQ